MLLSRGLIRLVAVAFLFLIRLAWKRNGYNDYAGFAEVEDTPLASPPSAKLEEAAVSSPEP